MSTIETIQKIAVGIIGIAMITTLILPGRQTPQVINAFAGLFSGSLNTALGTTASGTKK